MENKIHGKPKGLQQWLQDLIEGKNGNKETRV
jgi:hypothetical protein